MPADDLQRHWAEVWGQLAVVVLAGLLTVMMIHGLFLEWSLQGWREGETTLVKMAARLSFSSLITAFVLCGEALLLRWWIRR